MTLPEASRQGLLRSTPAPLAVSAGRLGWAVARRVQRVRQRGATPYPKAATAPRLSWAQRLGRIFTPMLLVKSLVLCLLLLTGLVGAHFAEQILQSPLRGFVVEGEHRYLEQADIADVLAPFMGEAFVTLPLGTLCGELAALPWIADVDLKRDWPDTLVISLVEQEPVARWGEGMLINRQGELFAPGHQRELGGLVQLDGPEGTQAEVRARFAEFSRLLASRNLATNSLRLSERGSWSAKLKSGVELVVGRHRVVEKLQRFLALYDRILAQYLPAIKRIDLRYHNGVAVQWRNGTGPGTASERVALATMIKE